MGFSVLSQQASVSLKADCKCLICWLLAGSWGPRHGWHHGDIFTSPATERLLGIASEWLTRSLCPRRTGSPIFFQPEGMDRFLCSERLSRFLNSGLYICQRLRRAQFLYVSHTVFPVFYKIFEDVPFSVCHQFFFLYSMGLSFSVLFFVTHGGDIFCMPVIVEPVFYEIVVEVVSFSIR